MFEAEIPFFVSCKVLNEVLCSLFQENHVGNRSIVIDNTERKQTVYIFKCTECTIQVKGKINSIVVGECE